MSRSKVQGAQPPCERSICQQLFMLDGRKAPHSSCAGRYFIPVVAIPVVMKRCRTAKTSVIGSRVITVIAST